MHVAKIDLISLLYKMLRFRTALLMLLFIAVSDAATKSSPEIYWPGFVATISVVALWYIFSTSTNDIADEEIDKINLKGNPNRPLINQQVSRGRLWSIALSSAVVALLIALTISKLAAAFTLGAIALSYAYSLPPFKVSHRGVLAVLLLPVGYVAFPFFLTLEINQSSFSADLALLLAGLYLCFAGRIILKDFRDLKGDRKFGKKTFLVRHGAKATCAASGILWLIGVGLLGLYFWSDLLVIALLILFFVLVTICLKDLSRLNIVEEQLQYVGLIGRLGNGAALIVLVALYAEFYPDKSALYDLLEIATTAFILLSAYTLYGPTIRRSVAKLT